MRPATVPGVQPIVILEHGADIPPGLLGDALAAAGVPAERVPLHAGAALPAVDECGAVVSLGGVMGAYDDDRYPFLAEEKGFLAQAVGAGVPVLGICLGCQLLADALGGRAYLAPEIELGYLAVDVVGDDPVVRELDRPTLVWHQDTWDLPPGATLLASTDRYPQAFRKGSALGLQPHPEATPAIARGWAATEGLDHFARAGIDRAHLLADMEAGAEEGAAMAKRLFLSWLRHDVGLA